MVTNGLKVIIRKHLTIYYDETKLNNYYVFITFRAINNKPSLVHFKEI